MLPHAFFLLGLLATSAAFALLEIQIEDGHGWAGALPTWRFENRWTRRFLGARPITGYHLFMHVLVLLLAHLAYFVGVRPMLRLEARILAFVILFWILEDFLWFIFNPAWGLRRFRRAEIPWHARSWWWIMPRDYWIFLPVAGLLYWLGWR